MGVKVLTVAALGLLAAIPASASASLVTAPAFPETVAVREASVPVVLQFTYSGAGKLVLASIRLTPSCGSTAFPCAVPDPGVFTPNGTGIGSGACVGRAFAVSAPAADGTLTLTPLPGDSHDPTVDPMEIPSGGTCAIALSLSVAKFPATDASLLTAGIQTIQHAEVTGTSSPDNMPWAATGTDQTTVAKRAPDLSTSAFGAARLGGELGDIATLSGAVMPGGTMAFSVFGPDDATCAGPAAFTSEVPVTSARTISSAFAPSLPGTYRWTASYSGDVNHEPAADACNAPDETVVISKAAPGLLLAAAPAAPAHGQIANSAVLSGGFQPTGTITFSIYGTQDEGCAGPVLGRSTLPVSGNGSYASAPFTAPTAGTYGWRASYGGDSRNEPAAAARCPGSAARPSVPGAPAPVVATRPVLGLARLSPASFRAAGSGPGRTAARVGTRVTYTLSKAARVGFRVERAAAGRRAGGRCAKPRPTRRRGRACTRYVLLGGAFVDDGHAGSNRLAFSGRLRGRKLRPGRYRLRALARDPAGRESSVKRRPFRIVR